MLVATLFLIISFGKRTVGSKEDPLLTYEKLYQAGVDAVRDKNWEHCIVFFERALDDFRFYKENINKCRIKCRREVKESRKESRKERNVDENNSDSFETLQLQFFQRVIQESSCLKKCKDDVFGERPATLDKKVATLFEDVGPYSYLQFCYYQVNKLKEGAAAAYTYFLRNPTDPNILHDIRVYREKHEVPDEDFIDLERKLYQTYHIQGDDAYNEEDWEAVVLNIEKALTEFYKEEELCRADCEERGILNPANTSDFVNLVADQYLAVLRCQYGCEDRLSRLFVEQVEDFHEEHYNFLQFAYFKLGSIDKAVEAVATFLLLRPDDAEMLRNKMYYMARLGYHDAHFIPRQAVKDYHDQRKKIQDFILYVEENNTSDDDDDDDTGAEDEDSTDMVEDHYMKVFEKVGISMFKVREKLEDLRFAADGIFREEHCDELRNLVNVVEPDSNGFREVTIPDAVEMARGNSDFEISLRMFLRACEVTRFFTSKYYNETKLFIRRAKLVCRDPSHGGDNEDSCYPQEDGSCLTGDDFEQVALSSSDDEKYTAVAYLTENKYGGKIDFLNSKNRVEARVNTKCGRIIGFQSVDRHSVNPAMTQRCVLFLTYTTNKESESPEHRRAMKFLYDKDEERVKKLYVNNAEVMKKFEREGVNVTMANDELKGEERFVADGLISDQQCQTLITLAKGGAVHGDGYRGKSPHTAYEIFAGLTVGRAAESGALAGDGYKDKPEIKNTISPHSNHEIFEGLTVKRASQLAHLESVSKDAVQMYLDVSERGRLLVERYFNLTRPLYFDYTHLVCRTAVQGQQDNRTDLSHPIHADNCQIQADGSCLRQFPAYTQRDYSAILYLNDQSGFDGGEFFFAHKNLSEQVSLKPKCGRIVGFNAAEFHGVKAITRGQRCAVAMWYTLDPNNAELAHMQARNMLSNMKTTKDGKDKIDENSEDSDKDSEAYDDEIDKDDSGKDNDSTSDESKDELSSKDENYDEKSDDLLFNEKLTENKNLNVVKFDSSEKTDSDDMRDDRGDDDDEEEEEDNMEDEKLKSDNDKDVDSDDLRNNEIHIVEIDEEENILHKEL